MKSSGKKQKLLFFYLKMGGGHIACARSIADYLNKQNKQETEIVMCDALEHTPRIKRLFEESYRISQNYALWAFNLTFELTKIPSYWEQNRKIITAILEDYIEQKILEVKPDKIVTFHCFIIRPVEKILSEHNLKTPFIAVVTDPFESPPQWFYSKKVQYVLSTPTSLRCAISRGIPKSHCVIKPTYMLNPQYSKRLSPQKIALFKNKLGLSKKEKIILLLGGGDGIPNGMRLTRTLARNHPDAEILMVAGRNELLRKQAEKLSRKRPNLHVYGFVDFVYELINISDIVITKCGASVIMEILMQGKLPIINSYLGDQEKSNMEFVVDNKLGFYEPQVSKLPALINRILKDRNIQAETQKNLARLHLRNATPDIAEYILRYKR